MSSPMKKTGVDYIGEIKSNFQLGTIGSLFQIKKDIIGHEPDTVLSITQKGIKIKDTESNNGQNAQSYSKYQIVNQGDFAMNHMDLLTGWIDISQYEGVTSPDYRVFKIKDDSMSSKYFLFLFQSYYRNKTFYGFGQGVANLGRWRLPANNFLGMFMPIPPAKEQKKIADLLDKKCSQIDALIANQQKEIEKLKQYKQSLITEVVTKGLDNNVSVKGSGVEWIGNIPEHWKITRIKYFLDNSEFGIKCGPFGSALTGKVIDNGEIIIYGQWNIVNKNFNIKRNAIAADDFESLSSYHVQPEDILVSMMGTIGRCAIVPKGVKTGIMDSHVIKIRLNREKILPEFFHYEYDKELSNVVIEYFNRKKKGFIMDGLNTSIIKNAIFVLPPIEEQNMIVSYLDKKCDRINRLIAIKQEKIDKLNDYKKSIIYEYVTGKKEVEMS